MFLLGKSFKFNIHWAIKMAKLSALDSANWTTWARLLGLNQQVHQMAWPNCKTLASKSSPVLPASDIITSDTGASLSNS